MFQVKSVTVSQVLHCVTLRESYSVTVLQCYNDTLLHCYTGTLLHWYNITSVDSGQTGIAAADATDTTSH